MVDRYGELRGKREMRKHISEAAIRKTKCFSNRLLQT